MCICDLLYVDFVNFFSFPKQSIKKTSNARLVFFRYLRNLICLRLFDAQTLLLDVDKIKDV